MKIVHITAGAGGRICGSCLHDNALVRALRERGRDALLVPAYVPTTTDEENVAEPRIMCGGVNVWLQEHVPLFRHTPWWLDRMFDGQALLEWLSKRTGGATPAQVAGLTVSTLAGERGHQRKEVEKLARWLAADVRPDVVHLSNALLVGFARRIRELTGAAVVCSLSGEDVFVEKIPQPHYGEVRRLLRERSRDVDRFVALNEYFADFMSRYLDVPPTSIAVVPHGVDVVGFPPRPPDLAARRAARGGRRVVGFLARLCPEKGLDQALRALAQLAATHDVELLAAGATSAAEEGYLAACRRLAAELGVAERFRWLGQVDRPGKLELLGECDVFTMPTAHPEAKGLPVIEALAAGLPVVVPDHGTFPELVGLDAGILHAANDPRAVAAGVRTVLDDPIRAASLGAAGHARARDRHTFGTMAAGHEAVYAAAIAAAGMRAPRETTTSRAGTDSDSRAPSR